MFTATLAGAWGRQTSMIHRTLFVADLDGTLLGPDATLSAYSRRTLRSLIAEGLLFTVATGRALPSIRAILGDVTLPLPVIELNGAFVSDLATGQHVAAHPLSPGTASAVMAKIHRRGLSAFIATAGQDADRLYYTQLSNPAMVWYHDEKVALADPRLRAIANPHAALDEPVVSFTLLAQRDAMVALAAEVRDELGDQVQLYLFENVYWRGWWELSIQDRRATKSGAIASLRRACDLESRRLVVFGDGLNDLDMFHVADHAVAVENAVAELAAVASEIAARNDQDGVVRWLSAALVPGSR